MYDAEKEKIKLDEKTAKIQQAIKFAQSEIDFAPNEKFVTLVFIRDNLQEILNLAKAKLESEV